MGRKMGKNGLNKFFGLVLVYFDSFCKIKIKNSCDAIYAWLSKEKVQKKANNGLLTYILGFELL